MVCPKYRDKFEVELTKTEVRTKKLVNGRYINIPVSNGEVLYLNDEKFKSFMNSYAIQFAERDNERRLTNINRNQQLKRSITYN